MASPDRSASKRFKPSHADEKHPTASSGHGSGKDEAPAAPTAPSRMTRLSDLEFVRILSRDPLSFEPYDVAALRAVVRDLRQAALRFVAESFNEEMREQFGAFQIWVLGEHAAKGFVEVPDWFVRETEEARRRLGGWIDVHLPERHFSTVVDEDGDEMLVFSFKEKDAACASESESGDNGVVSFSAGIEPELRPGFRALMREYSDPSRYKSPSSHADKKKQQQKKKPKPAAGASDCSGGEEAVPAMRMTRLPRMEVLSEAWDYARRLSDEEIFIVFVQLVYFLMLLSCYICSQQAKVL